MGQEEAVTIRKQIVVAAPIERPFTVFTGRFGDFKPPEHNMLGAPIAETVFEPRVGGGIVDRASDGSECRWARILAFEPPDRVVFSWDISPQWTIQTDPAQASEVEVRFCAESPARTRVELEHRHLDRYGPESEAVFDGVNGPEGWPLYLGGDRGSSAAHRIRGSQLTKLRMDIRRPHRHDRTGGQDLPGLQRMQIRTRPRRPVSTLDPGWRRC
jgi:uncharacterized protein YndB with AHSA1/START domain